MHPHTFSRLLEDVSNSDMYAEIFSKTRRKAKIGLSKMLHMTLWFLSRGHDYRSVGSKFGERRETARRAIDNGIISNKNVRTILRFTHFPYSVY